MAPRAWPITGVSSGFGRELTQQLLDRGDRVIGTVRDRAKVTDLLDKYPDTFRAELLDVTDTATIRGPHVHRPGPRRRGHQQRWLRPVRRRRGAHRRPFGIGMTIVEPGGARTEFRHGSAQIANLTPTYDTPAHGFLAMLDPAAAPAPGDPARMATRIIDSVDRDPAPLRMALGSQALDSTLGVLRTRVADFETQRELAASTDFPPGE